MRPLVSERKTRANLEERETSKDSKSFFLLLLPSERVVAVHPPVPLWEPFLEMTSIEYKMLDSRRPFPRLSYQQLFVCTTLAHLRQLSSHLGRHVNRFPSLLATFLGSFPPSLSPWDLIYNFIHSMPFVRSLSFSFLPAVLSLSIP